MQRCWLMTFGPEPAGQACNFCCAQVVETVCGATSRGLAAVLPPSVEHPRELGDWALVLEPAQPEVNVHRPRTTDAIASHRFESGASIKAGLVECGDLYEALPRHGFAGEQAVLPVEIAPHSGCARSELRRTARHTVESVMQRGRQPCEPVGRATVVGFHVRHERCACFSERQVERCSGTLPCPLENLDSTFLTRCRTQPVGGPIVVAIGCGVHDGDDPKVDVFLGKDVSNGPGKGAPRFPHGEQHIASR